MTSLTDRSIITIFARSLSPYPSVHTVGNNQNSTALRKCYLEYNTGQNKKIQIFEGKTQKSNPINCSRCLSKNYIPDLGFMNLVSCNSFPRDVDCLVSRSNRNMYHSFYL